MARREALLKAAEKVIGEKGFSAASIADITREAGTALGTFYIYFPTKEAVFHELVLEMGHATRAAVTQAIDGAPDRLAAEKNGLRAFLQFVAARPALYRIVEEARFVDPEAYRGYFTTFARAYATRLRAAAEAGEIAHGDQEVRAWALMGVAKTLGDRFVLWEEKPDLDHVVDSAFALIRDGLGPKP
ncbi:TetR/AcrR family transcriptional regulator [Psychromarinibacter sp. C21-152]|uniref:TetR/AcrR family transcriptional regulator n=1 Tax=Psychromarinibacter sediminicola TaxID=3033385 RepID=A0AAE3T8M3_9RHOB|nr:TetR/AcrR family transcriptional regulator [Psychromarinibacter sediminicola]MDF0599650.1 TetR/AcrR family transcriptional regulator [Psychromarinibacter sediminicola]